MPSPGSNSESIPGKFHFLCENYTEELTFTLVPGGVRNRGGANEQLTGAVRYDQSVQDIEGNLIHQENGMYLWLHEVYNHAADDESIITDIGYSGLASGDGSDGTEFVPAYSVSRSGSTKKRIERCPAIGSLKSFLYNRPLRLPLIKKRLIDPARDKVQQSCIRHVGTNALV